MKNEMVFLALVLAALATQARAGEGNPRLIGVKPLGGAVPSNVVLVAHFDRNPSVVNITIDGAESPNTLSDFYCGEHPQKCMMRVQLDLSEGTHDTVILTNINSIDEIFGTYESSGQPDITIPGTPLAEIEKTEIEGSQIGAVFYWNRWISIVDLASDDDYGVMAYALYKVENGERTLWEVRLVSYLGNAPQFGFLLLDEGEGEIEFHLTAIDLAGNESEPNIFVIDSNFREQSGASCNAAHRARDTGLPQSLAALLLPLTMLLRRRRHCSVKGA